MKNNKGFTLVELIVALAILGVVVGAVFSFLIFGNKTFASGNSQSDLQFDLRMATDFVKRDVRNATEIQIVDLATVPVADDGYKYIYVEGNILKHRSAATGFLPVNKTPDIVVSTSPMFQIVSENGKYLLNVVLIGDNGPQDYDTDTRVMLKNIKTATAGSGYAVKYK